MEAERLRLEVKGTLAELVLCLGRAGHVQRDLMLATNGTLASSSGLQEGTTVNASTHH
jgi:hypothetical protein